MGGCAANCAAMERGDPRRSVIMGFPQGSHRLSAASGAVFVVLGLVALLILGTHTPTHDDPPLVFARFYADKASTIKLSVLLEIFGAGAFVWFAGFLRWTYGQAEQLARGFQRATPTAFGGAIAGVAIAAVSVIAREGAVVAQGSVDPGVVRALDLMGAYSITAAAVVLSAFLLASFFLIRVTQVLPQWLGYLAMVGTALGAVQAVLLVAPQDDAGVLGALGYAWFGVFAIWTLGASLTLVRRVT